MNAQNLWQHAPSTALLLASFVGLFTWQVLTGTSITEPTTQDLIAWGANALPLTMINEPWRLLTSAFLHVGVIHLLFIELTQTQPKATSIALANNCSASHI